MPTANPARLEKRAVAKTMGRTRLERLGLESEVCSAFEESPSSIISSQDAAKREYRLF